MLAKKFAVSIKRVGFTKKKIEETGVFLFTQIKAGVSPSKLKGLFNTIDDKKLEKYTKSTVKTYTKAMDMGGSKVTDMTGKKVKLAKPNYDVQINSLVENNLKDVKNLGEDQKKVMIKKLQVGIKEGKSYGEMSTDINKSVKGMTESRAKTIASNEVNLAVSKSMEKTLKANGFIWYFYLTAGDDRVSDICNINSFGNKNGTGDMQRHMTGKGPIPVRDSHIRCRCSIVKAAD